MPISFSNHEINFKLSGKRHLNAWLKAAIEQENRVLGQISYAFCSDDFLLKTNNQYLKHDYYTDIITFDYSEGVVLKADILISIERVKDNAISLQVPFLEELHRVMLHGVLHLCGYNDSSEKEIDQMRNKENQYLLIRPMFHVEHFSSNKH
ncbi:MAG: rRNA maturation RNase YbeY [Chitinophagales bacterium]|nr:rRNA maturation RNase YbeY [Chitinophagales bacterium]